MHYMLRDDRLQTLLQNSNFARSIGQIRFVPMRSPTAKVQPGGFVEFSNEVGSFNQFVSKPQGMLAFTVLPILDDDITPENIYFSVLGITSTPPMEVVLRHIRNLTAHGDVLDRWNAPARYTIADTFRSIFQFLADNWRRVSPNVKIALRDTHLVPVGHQLIKPSRLFFRLAEDLSPFMHEVPRHFGAQEQFLKELGIKEMPSVGDYLRFLEDLAAECGRNALNPNELRAVVAILQAVGSQHSTHVSAGTSGESSDEASADSLLKEKLFVPDQHSVMRHAECCLFNDDAWLASKVRNNLQSLDMHLCHPFISADCASQLRIPTVSSVVVQELDCSHLQEQGGQQGQQQDCLQQQDYLQLIPAPAAATLVGKFSRVISDTRFIAALTSLLMSYETKLTKLGTDGGSSISSSRSSSSVEAGRSGGASGAGGARSYYTAAMPARVEASDRQAIEAALCQLRLRFVASLTCRFYVQLQSGSTPDSNSSSSSDDADSETTFSFLRRIDPTLLGTESASPAGDTLYELLVNCDPVVLIPPVSEELAVANGICLRLGTDTSLSAAVASLITAIAHSAADVESDHGRHQQEIGSTSSEAVSAVLNSLRLGEHSEAQRERLRGFPGELLLPQDEEYLQLRPFRLFRVGEVVAHRIPGIAADEESATHRNATVGKIDSKPSAAHDCYRYASVVSVEDASETTGLRRLLLRGGGGVFPLVSTDVYSFRSARNEALTTSQPPIRKQEKQLFAASTNTNTSSDSSSGTSSRSGGGNSSALLLGSELASQQQQGSQQQEELLEAVRGLLSRAGVPFSLDQQSLAERIAELDTRNKRLERDLVMEREQLAQSMQTIQQTTAALRCTICFAQDVTHVMIPCGHTICETCCGMLRGSRCPHCRRAIQSRLRFYLPEARENS